jgi:DNA-binding transcriptional LysR family regulator
MLNYNHLYYFHVAASESSLSAAAAKLGVKQSTVSEQLRTLERALRQRLFERTAGGMRLNPAGEIASCRVHALYQDGAAAELARRAIEKLIAIAQASVTAN